MNEIEGLVKSAKKNNREAQGELVLRLRPLIISSIKKYYYGSLDFEDLLQEGNLKILDSLKSFEEERGVHFLGYIKLQIKYHYLELSRIKTEALTLNNLTKEGSEMIDILVDESQDTEAMIINNEAFEGLKKALGNLTPKQIQIIDYVYLKGYKMTKVSKLLGLHYQTIVALKNRAIKNLKNNI